MLRWLQIEWFKIKTHKASVFLIVTYFALLVSITLLSIIKFEIGPIKFYLAEQGIFNFPYIWHLNTYVSALLKLFLMLVIVSTVTNEYANNTLKQNLIDGLSKREFILSKFIIIIVFTALSTLFVALITLVLGLVYSDYKDFYVITTDMNYLVAYFVKLLGFFSFALFLGILIKRSAFAVAGLIVWQVLEWIILGLAKWKYTFLEPLTNLLPLNAMSNLIKEPVTRFNAVKSAAKQLGQAIEKDFSVHYLDIFIVLLWTMLFVYGSYYLLKNRDL